MGFRLIIEFLATEKTKQNRLLSVTILMRSENRLHAKKQLIL